MTHKYTFSGHDSFQCRLFWLKKGYDFLQKGHAFSADDAPVRLGVGNNMVRSIRYWLRAFGLTDEADQPSQLARLLFDETRDDQPALDPFLEDQTTLWLLHYQLIKTRYASTYWLIFNELRKRKIEFSREDFIRYVSVKAGQEQFSANPGTVGDDFVVFTKLYLRGTKQSKEREDSFSGILTELDLLQTLEKKSEDGKTTFLAYKIEPAEREEIPPELLLYCLLDTPRLGLSISLETLEHEPDMPCAVFAMNRAGLLQKIEALTARYPFVTYRDQAGVRELQFKEKPTDPFLPLRQHYAPSLV
ncbi:MAG: DUF4007 family protein [Cytophagaceae bacterium]|nr:DUF4007 family protein [Cytophagaceae bacterium]